MVITALQAEAGKLWTACYNPVSYTHLRAHETVLDLVCRLLLEKTQLEYQTNHYRLKKLEQCNF